mgnify:CR=1 FL=1
MQTRIRAFINLIRLPNLLMLALVQILIIVFFLPTFIPAFKFETWKLIILVGSICFIAAGGNLINAHFDQQTDLINKSKHYTNYKILGKKNSIFLYVILSLLGLILGLYLSFIFNNYIAGGIYCFVFIALYLYSKYLKGSFLIGNLLVSTLIGLSILLPWIISVQYEVYSIQDSVFQLFLSYSLFATFINFARELAKDAEDIIGDFSARHTTCPILIGKKRTQQLVQVIVFFCLIGLLGVYFRFFSGQLAPMLYIFFGLISTGILVFVKAGNAKRKRNFKNVSTLLKFWMFLGLISFAFY